MATFAKLPISGTHSIIGAVVGFTVVLKGFTPLNGKTLTTIVLSWLISPILSGVISIFICLFIMKFIVDKVRKLRSTIYAQFDFRFSLRKLKAIFSPFFSKFIY